MMFRKLKKYIEKQDAENFLHLIAPKYLGVYVLNKETDTVRKVIAPDYLEELLQHEKKYSASLEKYSQTFVTEEDQEKILTLLDYDALYQRLKAEKKVSITYHKKDGAQVQLDVTFYRESDQKIHSIWIFSNEAMDARNIQLKNQKKFIFGLPQSDTKSNDFIMAVKNVNEIMRLNHQKEEELKEALQEAKSANEAKTRFINNISHDIRTPMNAIIGFTELAKNNITDPKKITDYLDKISMSGNHLLSLINDVLDMSRIESGTISIQEKPIHLPKLFHEIYTKTLHLGNQYGIKEGNPASFVVMDAKNYHEALNLDAPVLYSYKNGICIASCTPAQTKVLF